MRIQICPKCGTPMNSAFSFSNSMGSIDIVACPKCHFQCDIDDAVTDTMFVPSGIVETRAGLEGIEAQVLV